MTNHVLIINFFNPKPIWAGFCLALFAACHPGTPNQESQEQAPGYHRIVSLSGAITETIFALGHGEKVVGVDTVNEFEDFQALSAEALVKAQLEVSLLFDSGLQSLEGTNGLLKIPGIDQTPAGKNKRVITMEGHYLLGFGPRATQAALELAGKIHEK